MSSVHCVVQAPASTSNLGPAFDALGLAVDLHLTVRAEIASGSGPVSVVIDGEGASELPTDRSNLIVRTIQGGLDLIGQPLPGLRIEANNEIPIARGLGASAAARTAGHLIAGAIARARLSAAELTDRVAIEEGHPDNAAPCVLGGLVAASLDDGHVTAVQMPWPETWRLALFVPDAHISTEHARAMLPDVVAHRDATLNVGRTAILVAALAQGEGHPLRLATEDRLHQSFRLPLLANWGRLLDAARENPSLGGFISGAGSTVAAIVTDADAPVAAETMKQVAQEHGIAGRAFVVAAGGPGARYLA